MFRSKSAFERLLDKATSNLLLEPDLDSMLQLCDMVRGSDVKPREAAALIKAKVVEEKNPHQQFFAVNVMDTIMKNCGEEIHKEVITDSYMERLKELIRTTKAENVKNMLLEMVQSWGVAFKNNSDLKIACTLYSVLKAEGYKFPPEADYSGMFKAEKAPIWHDGNECSMSSCKQEFGLINRKHHCRACGGIFCGKCTTKQTIIPKFGIEREVRVCDTCYNELTTGNKSSSSKSSAGADSDLPAEYLNSSLYKEAMEQQKQTKPSSTKPAVDEAKLKEDEELQLALALSLDEQENRAQIQREKQATTSIYSSIEKPVSLASSNVSNPSSAHTVDAEVDPDLAHYFNRSYWEKKKEDQEKVAVTSTEKTEPAQAAVSASNSVETVTNGYNGAISSSPVAEETLQKSAPSISEEERKTIRNLQTSVEIFMNRMRSDQMRGRSISNDSAVQTLFQTINGLHPQIIQMLNTLEEKRLHQEALQDKLVQVRDARAALDALRADHAAKLKRAAEEAERQRQIQMAHKLELMRQKKQEYLAYQRQLAFQRMQEQEAARHARLQQSRQFIQQRAMQPSMVINQYGNYMPQPGTDPNMPPGVDPQQQQMNYMYAGAPRPQQQQQPGMHQPQQQQQMPGYNNMNKNFAGAAVPTTGYQQQMPPQSQQQGMSPQSMDPYNMTSMQNTLPMNQQQQPLNVNVNQVVATAPPPTPQPSNPSSIAGDHMPPQDPNMQYQMQQQHYYQQQPQEVQQPPPPGTVEADNLLISFD